MLAPETGGLGFLEVWRPLDSENSEKNGTDVEGLRVQTVSGFQSADNGPVLQMTVNLANPLSEQQQSTSPTRNFSGVCKIRLPQYLSESGQDALGVRTLYDNGYLRPEAAELNLTLVARIEKGVKE